jgi:hypothetical protein
LLALLLSGGSLSAAALTNSPGIELVPVAAGSFIMGEAANGDWDERPAHQVLISQPFLIAAAEISLDQFRQFRPAHNCSFEGKATGVSWNDAVAFCAWLSQREGKPYRLPTEAEWEYAGRAGTTTPFWSGSTPTTNAAAANPWGLRGTHDGVLEWCHDCYAPYGWGARTNPAGAAAGLTKVVRGGKPDGDDRLKDEKGRRAEDYHRSANRAGLPPAFGAGTNFVSSEAASTPGCHRVGFRVVQGEPPATPAEPVFPPFLRDCVQPPVAQITQAPAKPYFRKRHLLPIPPDNAPDEAIAAAGFPPSFRKHNHSPAFEVCPNGDLLLITYTSYFEYEPGVSLMAARLRFGEDEWDFPEPMFDTPDANDHATLLWTDWEHGGRLWFFWGWPKLTLGAFPFQWMTSDDSGATWSEVHFPRFTNVIGPHDRQPINTALRTADGTLFVPSDAEKNTSVLWATKDNGATWFDPGGRSAGRHTTYALLRDGAILGVGGKNTDIDGYMPKAISRDGGRTWRVSKTPFPALGVNQRPSLLRLRSGRLLFTGDFQKRGNLAPKEVTLRGSYVAWSDDDGETWRLRKLPGTQPHERADLQTQPDTLGYSAARQAPNGMIHLITTMNTPCLHFEFNEAWILSDEPTVADDATLMRSTAVQVRDAETFTGKFSDGALHYRWQGGVADDGRFLRHGKTEWFYAGGRPQYQAQFALGRPTGAETFWRPDGKVAWRWDHRADGTAVWTQFWETGARKCESNWRGTVADGPARTWDRNGRLTAEVIFSAGRLQTGSPTK